MLDSHGCNEGGETSEALSISGEIIYCRMPNCTNTGLSGLTHCACDTH